MAWIWSIFHLVFGWILSIFRPRSYISKDNDEKMMNLNKEVTENVINLNKDNDEKMINLNEEVTENVMDTDEEVTEEGVTLLTKLQSMMNDPSIYSACSINLQEKTCENSLFEVNNHLFIQTSRRINENGQFSCYELIIADNSDDNGKKRMAVLTAESVESELVELDWNEMMEDVIIDLNREGRRWEGGELNGKPFGFGCEYSENDNLVYEGFMFEGMKVCFGKEWNDDGNNNCLVYEGGYCNGDRWGKGKSYDLTGSVDFDGEWMNNHVMTDKENEKNNLIVPLSIEKFITGNEGEEDEEFDSEDDYDENEVTILNDNDTNDETITTLHFSLFLLLLKRIEIGNECFKHVREFVIDGLASVKSVKIGRDCFRKGDEKRDDGFCRITNCPNLCQLEIDSRSFDDFKSFELSDLNSLQSIYFGYRSFEYDAEFSLKGE